MNKFLEIALTQYGIREVAGAANNAEILKWFSATEVEAAEWVNDETPSCSAFACWVVEQAGVPSTKKVNARSWMDWGVAVSEPKPGDMLIYWRESPDSWKGHNAFFIAETKEGLWGLGANQNNMVCIAAKDRSQLLGIRRWQPTTAQRITNLNITDMSNLKGWRTIIFMVLTAALAGVDSLVDILAIPQWYYLYVVPAVGFFLRFLTTSAVGDNE